MITDMMISKVIVSVVIPVYNVEPYLRECIDSILSQTYKDLEIILIDDGSPDNCGKICDEYASAHQNIKVKHKLNEGLGMARNIGLDIAQGDYVYFHDSDDYLQNNEIANLVETIIKNKGDACYTGFTRVDESGKKVGVLQYQDEIFCDEDIKQILLPRMMGSSPEKKDHIEMASARQLYSMKLIREYNIRFISEEAIGSEDLIFNIDFLSHAKCACITSTIGAFYRINERSFSNKYQEKRFIQAKNCYELVSSRLQEIGCPDDAYLRLQRGFFVKVYSSIIQEIKKASPNSWQMKKYKVREIVDDELVTELLQRYPIMSLGIKQQIFLYLVKKKFVIILLLLSKMNYLIRGC